MMKTGLTSSIKRRPLSHPRVALIFAVVITAFAAGVLAQPGDIYVTNLATNTIDVYSPDGTKTVFASGLNSPQGLVFDRDNNLYVADGGTGSIFKYDTSGTQTVFYTGLEAPVGLAIDGGRLLIAENGTGRVVSLKLDGSGALGVFITSRDGILGVAVGGNTRWMTYGSTLNSLKPNTGTWYPFSSNTQGVFTVRRAALDMFEAYCTTAAGEVWRIRPAETKTVFADGLIDPNGMAFLPGAAGDEDRGELYVADRGSGQIVKFTLNGKASIFISDAGIPNFLAADSTH